MMFIMASLNCVSCSARERAPGGPRRSSWTRRQACAEATIAADGCVDQQTRQLTNHLGNDSRPDRHKCSL